ncbi:hypothetical protein AVEN_74154-1 [Araneus ventricosus]|uniref:Uncharacterized protein n=1 Tax=Araneus ventricosus TaxID=182803 RepID=A0A4Y2J318_ARAVE|nr:hypothetical protein AVEN_74154-1 [Araneus ventricosus]
MFNQFVNKTRRTRTFTNQSSQLPYIFTIADLCHKLTRVHIPISTTHQINKLRVSNYCFRFGDSFKPIVVLVSSVPEFLLERHRGRPRAQYGNWVTGVSPKASHWSGRLRPSGDLTPPFASLLTTATHFGAGGVAGRGVFVGRNREGWNRVSGRRKIVCRFGIPMGRRDLARVGGERNKILFLSR